MLLYRDKLEEDKEFDIVGDLSDLYAKPEEESTNGATNSQATQQEGELMMPYNFFDVIHTCMCSLKALSQLAHDQKRPNSRAIEKFRFGS